MIFKYSYLFCLLFILASPKLICQNKILLGSERVDKYIDDIKDKRVAIVCNNASLINNQHIVDKLISLNVDLVKIFSPEHGFWLKKGAGELIYKDDNYKNIKIISIYGKTKKIKNRDLKNIDIMLFDIQDVGVRFYTYISTLHYVMESCNENNIPLIVLDRPNPNINYIDGPVLDTSKFKSFVGMHPVPVVYGMTIGEYAHMIKGQKWINNNSNLKLKVIPCFNYNRNSNYIINTKPSPNLPNHLSVKLYPSLCFFEGTNVSVGRGTDYPFQIFGSPFMDSSLVFKFIPKKNSYNKYPKHQNKECFGINLKNNYMANKINKLTLKWLIFAYNKTNNKKDFFNNFFNLLAGNSSLKQKIIKGYSEYKIKKSWKKDIKYFKKIRGKYLIY